VDELPCRPKFFFRVMSSAELLLPLPLLLDPEPLLALEPPPALDPPEPEPDEPLPPEPVDPPLDSLAKDKLAAKAITKAATHFKFMSIPFCYVF
jgi:hypothetical protein